MLRSTERLLGIAKQMSSLPCAPKIQVFGSMAELKENPVDIDVFVDMSDIPFTSSDQCREFFDLIRLAHRNYGYVDPFIRFSDALVVRNDEASGWMKANNRRAIEKNMASQAKPLADVIRHYSRRLEAESAPSP